MKILKSKIDKEFLFAKKALSSKQTKKNVKLMCVVVVFMSARTALAIDAPVDTESLGYDLYDIVVNQILKGGIGFVGGLSAVVYSATKLMENWKPALAGIVGGTMVVKADAITSTFGMLI